MASSARSCPLGRFGQILSFLSIVTLVGALGIAPAWASQARRLSLEEMTAKAGRIVAGRCVDVQVGQDAQLGLTVTFVSIETDRTLKGPADSRITFKMLGDATSRSSAGVQGGSRFQVGEDVLVFLYPESVAGFTSPIGLGQGKFTRAPTTKGGRALMTNGLGNLSLFANLSVDGATKLGAPVDAWKHEAGIPLDVLTGMVRSLMKPAPTVKP